MLPGAGLKASDIWASYAGLRPLSAPSKGAAGNSKISREDQILEQGGLLSLTGGKFTTYRAMAEKAVDRAMQALGLPRVASRTAAQGLPGAPKNKADFALLESGAPGLAARYGLPEASAAYLISLYGVNAMAVLELCKEDEGLKEPLAPGEPGNFGPGALRGPPRKDGELGGFLFAADFFRLGAGAGP